MTLVALNITALALTFILGYRVGRRGRRPIVRLSGYHRGAVSYD